MYFTVALVVFGVFTSQKSHAASINVVAGNDAVTVDSNCSLSEAIQNFNDQADTNADCVETGTYGVNDKINLPTGTITLTTTLAELNVPVDIEGAGMQDSVIDGNGFGPLRLYMLSIGSTINVSDFKVTGFTTRAGLDLRNADFNLSRIEIDATDATYCVGLSISYTLDASPNISIEDLYIHNVSQQECSGVRGLTISPGSGSTGTSSIEINRATINDLESVDGTSVGISLGGGGSFEVTLSNITVENLTGDSDILSPNTAILMFLSSEASYTNNIALNNVTFRDVNGQQDSTAGIALISAELLTGLNLVNNLTLTNTVLSDLVVSCMVFDLGPLFIDPAAISTNNLLSGGGNITDDNSCNLTQPSDQQNNAILASFLGLLSDNGGFVPTIPLLEGSPAIDSGVTIGGLLTDARMMARPQSIAFDSGAYESIFASTDDSDEEESTNDTNSSQQLLIDTGQSINWFLLLSSLTVLVICLKAGLQKRKL